MSFGDKQDRMKQSLVNTMQTAVGAPQSPSLAGGQNNTGPAPKSLLGG